MHRSKKLEASIYSICCCYNKTKLLGTNSVLATSSNCWPICSIGSVMKTSGNVHEAQSAAPAWAKPDVGCLSYTRQARTLQGLISTVKQCCFGETSYWLIKEGQMFYWIIKEEEWHILLINVLTLQSSSENKLYNRPSPQVWSLLFFLSERNAFLLPHFLMFCMINGITKNIQKIISLYYSNLELVSKLIPVSIRLGGRKLV